MSGGSRPIRWRAITLTGDVAWRLFTRQKIDPRAVIEGDERYAQPALRMVSII